MEHSVSIEYARCRGCTTCMKSCPTQAIRVRRGKATIIQERCVDCGECIRSCPHKAIKAVSDPLSCLERFQYTVALPDPVLYGQFRHLEHPDLVLDALTKLGFDAVFETAKAACLLSDYAQRHPSDTVENPKPVISSACPAVLRLIRIRFPQLLEHITSTISPMELSAILARRKAAEETGLPMVFLHGYGQSRMGWMTTPDGREGWSEMFLRKGHGVFLIDEPRRGEAGATSVSGDISTKTLDQRWYTQFRIGRWENGESVVNEGSQFPNDAASVDQFFRQMTPDTGMTSDMGGDFDNETVAKAVAEAARKSGVARI